jgi:hypothetical protein
MHPRAAGFVVIQGPGSDFLKDEFQRSIINSQRRLSGG